MQQGPQVAAGPAVHLRATEQVWAPHGPRGPHADGVETTRKDLKWEDLPGSEVPGEKARAAAH